MVVVTYKHQLKILQHSESFHDLDLTPDGSIIVLSEPTVLGHLQEMVHSRL